MKYFPDNSNYSLKEFLSSYSATLSNVLDEIDEDKLNQTFKVISKAIKSINSGFNNDLDGFEVEKIVPDPHGSCS